jgi:GxxExxY protein
LIWFPQVNHRPAALPVFNDLIMETDKKTIVNPDYRYSELTGKIIGCAMKVHSNLGNGFPEAVYQRSLAIEMERQGLTFSKELVKTIYYEGIDVGNRRVDFLVEDKIMIELKAIAHLEDTHLSQAINYLKAYQLETGLLINSVQKIWSTKE